MKSYIESYGGSQEESCSCMAKTIDGGYILTGSFTSNDIDFKGLKKGSGLYDTYVMKLYRDGSIEWIKAFGGDSYDHAVSIIQCRDESFVLLGTTQSSKNESIPFHSKDGSVHSYILKLSTAGELIWVNPIESEDNYEAKSLIEDENGDLVVTGAMVSNYINERGFKSRAPSSIFVSKFLKSGVVAWSKNYGGSNYDRGLCIINTEDGGYAVTGFSQSNDGDFIDSRIDNNRANLFFMKLTGSGHIELLEKYGGSGQDQGNSIAQTDDKGFVIVGETNSGDGDFDRFKEGVFDSFILKLSERGEIEWKRFYGGIGDTRATSVIMAHSTINPFLNPKNRSIFTVGFTTSSNGDFEGLKKDSGQSVFIVKLNKFGGSEWKRVINSFDAYCSSIVEDPYGTYALAGHARSFKGIKGFRKGEKSIFFLKIDESQNRKFNESKNLFDL